MNTMSCCRAEDSVCPFGDGKAVAAAIAAKTHTHTQAISQPSTQNKLFCTLTRELLTHLCIEISVELS